MNFTTIKERLDALAEKDKENGLQYDEEITEIKDMIDGIQANTEQVENERNELKELNLKLKAKNYDLLSQTGKDNPPENKKLSVNDLFTGTEKIEM